MLANAFTKIIYRKLYQHPLVSRYIHTHQLEKTQVGWGYKKSGISALKNNTFTLFEDGFIRSLFPGYHKAAPYSLVADHSGIYYDATGKSDLIHFLNGKQPQGEQWQKEITSEYTTAVLARIRQSGVSKYNCHLDQRRSLEVGVLVVDQTAGDAAIKYSGMEQSDFDRMLQDAIEQNPGTHIYLKTHPDHQYREKYSCFSQELIETKKITILPSDMSSAEALRSCHTVYVGSSLLGMEGLIHGKKVITYGWNFYAGWGLTEDRASVPKPPRNKILTIEQLFEAAYLRYTHYFDPDTQAPCDIHRVIDHILFQWQQWKRHQSVFVTCGLSPWQEKILLGYLGPKDGEFIAYPKPDVDLIKVLTWGAKEVPDKLKDHSVTRAEDGFIRSNGLGANFHIPFSLVFDDVGIYFDARSPSKLENLLESHIFSESELLQAQELVTYLRENKLTKYNLGIKEVTLPKESAGKKVILIPGQVDSDASIKYGSPKLCNNRELLAEVRSQHPDAYICYKPHPDLLSGARKDAPLWQGIELDVDFLVTDGDIISWIQAVDEVHTLTSTVGFEALIHGKPVYTYGLPFYAGWGLTKDWLHCERRTAEHSLIELACATLILYPTYLNPKTGEYMSALNAAKILVNPDFKYDSRTVFLKLLGKVKTIYYKLCRNRR